MNATPAATATRDDVLAGFTELLPEPVLLVGGGQAIRAANRAALSFLGRSAADTLGRRLDELVLDDAGAVAVRLREWSRSNQPLPGALRFAGRAGVPLDCRCDGALHRPRDGGSPLLLLRLSPRAAAAAQFVLLNQRIDQLTHEIGLRRRAEATARAQAEHLRVTLASIGDAVITTDARGHVTLMNAVAETLTGWAAVDAVGRSLAEVFVIVDEQTRAPADSPVAQALREGRVVGLANHTVLLRRDGSERHIDDSAAPIRDDAQRVAGVVLVFHDVTERRRLEHELQDTARTLQQNDRRKDDFLSMLAHELRNPLAPLRTGVELLGPRRERADIERVAAMMRRQIGHMTRLVDDLLDVARITRGSVPLHRAPVALAQVLHQAFEMSRALAEAGGQSLVVEPLPPTVVDADAARLVQVFGNLLANAVKFSAAGGRIFVQARERGDEAIVTVRDEGEGIDAELLPQVFELFVQADRSLQRPRGGLGIGLALARTIVEQHGGRIEAASAGPGRGSEFTVRLPRLPAVAPAHDNACDDAAADTAGVAALAWRVLVVDDNVDAAQSLCEVLALWGHQAEAAHDAQRALELWPTLRPQLALLDIGLPGIDGYELARRLRRRADAASTRLIAVTGYGQPGDRQRSAEAGFDEHLTKPVDLQRLQQRLAQTPPAA